MKKCEMCGAEQYRMESKFCAKCGNTLSEASEPMLNTCTNPDCEYHKTKFIYPDDTKFCDICGSKTEYAD